MEYGISLTCIGIIFLDVIMLWACWMAHRHLTLISREERRSELKDADYHRRLLLLKKDRSHMYGNALHADDEH